MAKFTEVLKNRDFFFLWLGQIISQFGDRLDQMALIALISRGASASTFQLAKLFSVTILPVFIIGPIAGVYVDRWNKRSTMYVCDFLRGILVLIIAFFLINQNKMLLLYIAVFLVFCLGRFFVPAKLSIIPELVKPEELFLANSLVNTTGMIAAILGLGLGGVLVFLLGVKGGFLLDAVSFLISALFIIFIRKRITAAHKRERLIEVGKEMFEVIRKSVMQEFIDGIKYLLKQKEIRVIASINFVLFAALGAVYVVSIVFIQETLRTITKDLGLLVMFLGAGLLTGTLIYGRLGHKIPIFKTIFFCLFVSGIVMMMFSLGLHIRPSFFFAAVLAFILGLFASPIISAANTLVHKASAQNMQGKVFSSLEVIMHLAFLLFMFVSASLAEFVGRFIILMCVGILFSLTGLFGFFRFKSVKDL